MLLWAYSGMTAYTAGDQFVLGSGMFSSSRGKCIEGAGLPVTTNILAKTWSVG